MPRLNGLDAARAIRKASPDTKLILLTVHTEEQYVLEALRAGIKGYVLKTQAAADLIRAIQEVSRNAVYLSPGISRTVVDACCTKPDSPTDPLTDRERQVLQLVAEGLTTKDIAKNLSIGIKTVETYRAQIMEKLDLHNTAAIVRYAIRRGLLQP